MFIYVEAERYAKFNIAGLFAVIHDYDCRTSMINIIIINNNIVANLLCLNIIGILLIRCHRETIRSTLFRQPISSLLRLQSFLHGTAQSKFCYSP